ncbi:MAG TPA: NADH-quinone oxidoreductase subunit J [Chthoniobacterales bacterium]|nr:NADH-quinone oxidoreductase subunit J [Chthoniobacterales bacterium]
MNTIAFASIAIVTLTFALAAATNPRLMHAALSFAAMFVGIAAFFFLLGAEFVGLVQIFVYVGAVAVLIVFTILLTRRDVEQQRRGFKWSGVLIAIVVFAGLIWAIFKTPAASVTQAVTGGVNMNQMTEGVMRVAPALTKALTVKQIGESLMTHYVWPLLCVGVLLTAALIGALILVMEDKPE